VIKLYYIIKNNKQSKILEVLNNIHGIKPLLREKSFTIPDKLSIN
jgi:hypothetical protein